MPLDFPSNPTNGQVDPSGQYVYDSSITSWRNIGSTNNLASRITDVANTVGLVPIIPSTIAVSGGTATVNSSALISFSSVTSIDLFNVFSSTYKSYHVVLNTPQTSSDGLIQCRFITGTSVNTATDYARSLTYNNAGTTATSQNTGDSRIPVNKVGVVANLNQSATFDIYNPALAAPTSICGTGLGWYLNVGTFAGWFNANTQFDGLRIMPEAGTFSGTVQVYGYR